MGPRPLGSQGQLLSVWDQVTCGYLVHILAKLFVKGVKLRRVPFESVIDWFPPIHETVKYLFRVGSPLTLDIQDGRRPELACLEASEEGGASPLWIAQSLLQVSASGFRHSRADPGLFFSNNAQNPYQRIFDGSDTHIRQSWPRRGAGNFRIEELIASASLVFERLGAWAGPPYVNESPNLIPSFG